MSGHKWIVGQAQMNSRMSTMCRQMRWHECVWMTVASVTEWCRKDGEWAHVGPQWGWTKVKWAWVKAKHAWPDSKGQMSTTQSWGLAQASMTESRSMHNPCRGSSRSRRAVAVAMEGAAVRVRAAAADIRQASMFAPLLLPLFLSIYFFALSYLLNINFTYIKICMYCIFIMRNWKKAKKLQAWIIVQ